MFLICMWMMTFECSALTLEYNIQSPPLPWSKWKFEKWVMNLLKHCLEMAETVGCTWGEFCGVLFFPKAFLFLIFFLLEVSVISSCLKPLTTVLRFRNLSQTLREQNKMEQLSDKTKQNKKYPIYSFSKIGYINKFKQFLNSRNAQILKLFRVELEKEMKSSELRWLFLC